MKKIILELSSMELRGAMPCTQEEKHQAAVMLGRAGGKKSVESRFKNMTKEEKSAFMRKVRLTPKQEKEVDAMANDVVESLRKI